jgi:sulfite reductase (NADPH) flavoprotein alpha-component
VTTSAPAIPIIPESAPFTPEQRAWLNGFIAGMLAKAPMAAAAVARAEALRPLTILFCSQTGTAEALAKRAAKLAGQRGFAATIVDMAQTELARLAQEPNILLITSTHGEGEPPDNARALHAALRKPGGPHLSGVRFSVCGLGDTNYVRFCQAAKDFDDGLEKLGGLRIVPRAECDVDYEKGFSTWIDSALASLGAQQPAAATAEESIATETSPSGFSRKSPYPAPLMVSRSLNGEGSGKHVRHIEFSLGDSGMRYEAGDALGVWPQNCPKLVTEVLARIGCDGEEAVTLADGSATSLRCALSNHCDLGRPSADLAARFAAPTAQTPSGMHVIDLIAARPETRLAPTELVRMLRPLSPRLYSISSSPLAHGRHVHLTVAAVRYAAHGRARSGTCSTFLSDRAVPGETRVGIFVQPNPSFRLPQNGETPIIMVGPGTGIAPFRAFLHERRASGATGRSWLFFGDQHLASDFLYGDELTGLHRDGSLTRIDTAFSRDQEEKIYVQNRMLAQAPEIYSWLEDGAHFYVCGDASRMAKDVEAALQRIVEQAGGKSPVEAADYVQGMRSAKRYCRDVY